MSSGPETDALKERLNDLYWHSDTTIDEIVHSVGVTRNRLYESVRPLAADERCPTCAEELIFPNRRSRLASSALCPSCGRETIVSVGLVSTLADPSQDGFGVGEDRDQPGTERPWAFADRKRALIGGAAALGAMIGAAATRVIKD